MSRIRIEHVISNGLNTLGVGILLIYAVLVFLALAGN